MLKRFTTITTMGAAALFLPACSHGPEDDQPASQTQQEGYLTPQDTIVILQGGTPTVQQSDSAARRDTSGGRTSRQRRPS